MLDDVGRVAPPGNTVMNPDCAGETTVRLSVTPLASGGIVQFPLVPVTWMVCVVPDASAVPRGPTWEPARVSMMRQGVM